MSEYNLIILILTKLFYTTSCKVFVYCLDILDVVIISWFFQTSFSPELTLGIKIRTCLLLHEEDMGILSTFFKLAVEEAEESKH